MPACPNGRDNSACKRARIEEGRQIGALKEGVNMQAERLQAQQEAAGKPQGSSRRTMWDLTS